MSYFSERLDRALSRFLVEEDEDLDPVKRVESEKEEARKKVSDIEKSMDADIDEEEEEKLVNQITMARLHSKK